MEKPKVSDSKKITELQIDEMYTYEELIDILKKRDLHNIINLNGNNTWIDRKTWFEKYRK